MDFKTASEIVGYKLGHQFHIFRGIIISRHDGQTREHRQIKFFMDFFGVFQNQFIGDARILPMSGRIHVLEIIQDQIGIFQDSF